MTTKQEISDWFDRGVVFKCDFMIIVCDTFDHEDYPVFCSEAEFDKQHSDHNGKNMQRIMEVYNLSMDRDSQLAERRAFNLPGATK